MDQLRQILVEVLGYSRSAPPMVGVGVGLLGILLLLRGAGLVRGFMGLAGGLVLAPVLGNYVTLPLSGSGLLALGALAGFVLGGFFPVVSRALAGAALVSVFLPSLADLTRGTTAGEALALTIGAAGGVYLAAWFEVALASLLGLVALAFGGEVLFAELQPLSSIFSLSVGVLPPGPDLSPPRIAMFLLLGLFALALHRQGQWMARGVH